MDKGFSGMRSPRLLGLNDHGRHDGYYRLTLQTDRGDLHTRFYPVAGATAGVIMVGGVGGGFDTPAKGLYGRLGRALPRRGLAVLRVQLRNPTLLNESVHDVLAGAMLLERHGIQRLGLVGHSFGGAVVVQAAAVLPETATVVTLATQSQGAEAAASLAPRALFLIHGDKDEILPAACSEYVYRIANGPKDLVILSDAGHLLDEADRQVFDLVLDWLTRYLGQPAAKSA